MSDRPKRFPRQMSDAEALMWNVEHDPWFSSTFGAVSLLERPADADLLRARLAVAVADVPRLRERVSAGLGRLAPPRWVPDPDFDLDDHLRHIALPAPGSTRQLLDVATRLLADPFDRSGPLWRLWLVDGLEGGQGALITKLHHTIADGEGGIGIARSYVDFSSGTPDVPDVDLDAVVARAAEEAADTEPSPEATTDDLTLQLLRHLGQARRVVGEVVQTMADPGCAPDEGVDLVDQVIGVLDQLTPSADGPAGSSIWTRRSRRRRLEVVSGDLAALRAAAHRHGGTLNDAFLCALSDGAARYHAEVGGRAEAFRATLVVSTRAGGGAGANAFTPVRATLPGGDMSSGDRMARVAAATATARESVSGGGFLSSAAGVANLLPTAVLTRFARRLAARVDFATSNVGAAPVPAWVGGARITATYPLGPVAGTAFNATLMSYCDRVEIGLHVDPAAVTDTELLQRCIADGVAALCA